MRRTRPPWLVLLPAWLALAGCPSGDDDDSAAPEAAFEPSLVYHGEIAVLRVGGTAYEMGFQHGSLMGDELHDGASWIDSSEMALLEPLADYHGLLDEAYANSYPDVLDECQGMVDAMDDPLWSMERCVLLAYGDVVLEVLAQELSGGCSQLVAQGAATGGGELVHARNLDWTKVDYIIDHPTLIVRHPDGGIPNVVFGFPGNVSPYSGMNAAGIALASNEAHGLEYPDREGHGHTQMQRQILQECRSVDDVRAFLEAEDHVSAEILVVSDAAGDAAVFEMTDDGIGERRLSDGGVLYATNHFVHDVMAAQHQAPGADSVSRLQRLEQLAEPAADDSLHGGFDPATAVALLRDTFNPVTGVEHPTDLEDGGGSLANNGAIQSMVMLPESGRIYVAEGGVVVPHNPFRGFTLDELLGVEGAAAAEPAVIE